jgi:hypothetical protein
MRRCTVYKNSRWWDTSYAPATVAYEGWLIDVHHHDSYPKACVVDLDGRMQWEDIDEVKLHVPTAIPLHEGAATRQ